MLRPTQTQNARSAWHHSASCEVCSRRFVLATRPHHCRRCGRTVCWSHFERPFCSICAAAAVKVPQPLPPPSGRTEGSSAEASAPPPSTAASGAEACPYVATVDVLPQLLRECSAWQSVKEILAMCAGIGLMLVVMAFE